MDDISYGLVAAEVNREYADRAADLRGLDSKGGGVLAFAGALAAFAPAQTLLLVRMGRVAAIAAAVLAVCSLVPRDYPALSPLELRRYLREDADTSRIRILDTKIEAAIQAASVIRSKSKWLKRAILLISLAMVLVAAGAWHGTPPTSKEQRTWPTTTTTATPPPMTRQVIPAPTLNPSPTTSLTTP